MSSCSSSISLGDPLEYQPKLVPFGRQKVDSLALGEHVQQEHGKIDSAEPSYISGQ